MLNEFDIARNHASIHEVSVHHGRVAEALFRNWLTSFLPKRYGVCSGYLISQGAKDVTKVPHFDVIIYDALDAPLLWAEDYPDTSELGASRAIPVEHARAVFEVKATLSSDTAQEANRHLADLKPLLDRDTPSDRYPKFLPINFVSFLVFFEVRRAVEHSAAALDNLVALHPRGYRGAVIFRGENGKDQATGRVVILTGNEPVQSTVGIGSESLIDGSPLSNSKSCGSGKHISAMLNWSEANFSMFAFDVLAMLNKTYRPGFGSSLHGMSWLNPNRQK